MYSCPPITFLSVKREGTKVYDNGPTVDRFSDENGFVSSNLLGLKRPGTLVKWNQANLNDFLEIQLSGTKSY
jgi:hypothetical protein